MDGKKDNLFVGFSCPPPFTRWGLLYWLLLPSVIFSQSRQPLVKSEPPGSSAANLYIERSLCISWHYTGASLPIALMVEACQMAVWGNGDQTLLSDLVWHINDSVPEMFRFVFLNILYLFFFRVVLGKIEQKVQKFPIYSLVSHTHSLPHH